VITIFLKSSSLRFFLSIKGSQNFSLNAFSRYRIITTQVSTAFQNKDMNHTDTATEKLNPERNNAIIHQTRLKGILEATIATSQRSL
jgi:hypothetical protein